MSILPRADETLRRRLAAALVAARASWLGFCARVVGDLVALFCALTIVAALVCPFIPALDFFNHFQPVWTVTALGTMALAWIGGGRVRMRRAALVALVSVYLLVSPVLRLASATFAAGVGVSVKLMTFNVLWSQQRPDDIAAFIRAEQPDIVVLQEVHRRTGEALNASLRDAYPHRRFCNDWTGCDSAILSKWPIRDSRHILRSENAPPAISSVVQIDGYGSVRVVGVHFMNPSDPRRQQRELEWLIQHVRASNEAVIVAGDLNLTPWTAALRQLERRTGLTRATGLGGTWPATSRFIPPLFPIDHVLAPTGVAVMAARRGPKLGSDHLPVIATLLLPQR